MPTFLLIGPSGAGKTTACEIITKKSDIKIFDLDKVLKSKIGGGSLSTFHKENGDERLFEISKEAIQEIESSSEDDTIIVIGAGSINLDSSHEWYKQKNLLSLSGDAEKLYDRGNRQVHHPTIDSYINTEFKTARKSLYQSSKFCLDVTDKSPDEIADEIIKAIKNYR